MLFVTRIYERVEYKDMLRKRQSCHIDQELKKRGLK